MGLLNATYAADEAVSGAVDLARARLMSELRNNLYQAIDATLPGMAKRQEST
jgi:hypothetical protein